MQGCAEDIKDMLEAESSLELTFATDLFIGREPDTPDNCVMIFDTSDRPRLDLSGNSGYYDSSVQIRVRDRSYVTGQSLMNDIVVVLHGRPQQSWNGALYTLIQCVSGPALLEWDENNRVKFIANFNIQRR